MFAAPERGSLRAVIARHKGVAWASVLLTFALAGPVGATSGAMLHLGVSNTSNATTTLRGTTAAPELTVSNASTSSSARALSATSNSSAGTIYSRNNGTGPALSVSVPSGRAPLSVSAGAAKVANLDADKLDGLDSSSFARGRGTTTISNMLVLSNGQLFVDLLDLGPFGKLQGYCGRDLTWVSVEWVIDNTPIAVRSWNNNTTDGRLYPRTLDPGWSSGLTVAKHTAGGTQHGDKLVLGQGGSTGTRRTATVTVGAFRAGTGAACDVQATAILATIP